MASSPVNRYTWTSPCASNFWRGRDHGSPGENALDSSPIPVSYDRRAFLRFAGAAALGGFARPGWSDAGRRLKVAAIFTEFTYRSHAHVILENFLEPYYFNGRKTESGCDVVS